MVISDFEKELLNGSNPAAMESKLGDIIQGLQKRFQSTEQTGTGSEQSIPHGLGVVPKVVIITFSSIPAEGANYKYTKGSANVKVTATKGAKYFVTAMP